MTRGPRSTVWPLDEHTRGKHLILRNYLNAWLPILGQTRGRIVFIDAFAGPGIYEGGEPGSPVIALRAIREHSVRSAIRADVRMLFIEADQQRFETLQREVSREAEGLPTNVHHRVKCGRFDETVRELLDELDQADRKLAPTFMMVDPFGISGTPMTLLSRFLGHGSTEILITFMVDFIDRFDEGQEFPPHLNDLFGCPDWSSAADLPTKDDRRSFLFDLYELQLRRHGARYVIRVDMWEGQRLIYGLFHASGNLVACAKMKEAIWRACPAGDFAFRGSRHGQLGFELGADFSALPREMETAFQDRGWFTIEEIQEWIRSDETLYCPDHLRQYGLKPLEVENKIEVEVLPRRRGKTYPPGKTRIRFHEPHAGSGSG